MLAVDDRCLVQSLCFLCQYSSQAQAMISLYLGLQSSSASFKSPLFASFRSSSSSLVSNSNFFLHPLQNPIKWQGKFERGICRADPSHDAPVAVAIGACVLSSFLLPVAKTDDDDEEDGAAISSIDTRLAAMGIISFIPYFNWLSWIFAWLDTGKRRYAVYSLVYLLPYLSSGLSISPEDSWLPLASIILGIIHVQLEASIRNGDLPTFQFFNERFSSMIGKEKYKHTNLSRNDIPRQRIPKRHEEHNADWNDDEEQ